MSGTLGSPPRAWGQSEGGDRLAGDVRFTPTRVGTMPKPSTPASRTSVHPHARGDNLLASGVVVVSCGSPPRAWGQCELVVRASSPLRFTPTRVGTIERQGIHHRNETVHPHARGDNISASVPITLPNGSPPRAWGQSLVLEDQHGLSRFTPTRVGTIPTPR